MMQNKTFKIILFIALFLLIIFSWIYVKDLKERRRVNEPVNTGIENPFGNGGEGQDLPFDREDPEPIEEEDNTSSNTEPDNNIVIIEDNPTLKQFTQDHVAGFTFVEEKRIIEKPEAQTLDDSIVEVYDFSGYKTIRFGDKADEILAIKTVLNRQTPSPALAVNNQYDTDMKNAVIDFQNKNSLTGDGVIGSKTYAKLNEFQGIKSFSSVKQPDDIEIVEMVRFVDSATGIMFDKAVRKNEEQKPITKTPIPKVVEAFFDNSATKVVLRYLKEESIQTYLVNLIFPKIDTNLTKEEQKNIDRTATISGEFLPENIETLSVSRDGKGMFYFNPVVGGVSGIYYNFATKAKKELWRTGLTEWIADFGSENKINITTKSSGLVPGYAYLLDTKTSELSKSIGDRTGLTTLISPDGKKILYSVYENSKLSTFIFDLVSQKSTAVSPSTLPEKCVWTKDSKKIYCGASIKNVQILYPDDWYKGKATFEDALWVIDLNDFTGNIVYDIFSKSNKRIDITNIKLNTKNDYLMFVNKKDGTLWGYDLNQ